MCAEPVPHSSSATRSRPASDVKLAVPRGQRPRKQRGLTLVEIVIFIVVVGAALAGVLTVYDVSTRASADPIIHKQMLAIAESLMEEVQMLPFTHCDPSDANALTATGPLLTVTAVPCATLVQSFGQRNGQTRTAFTMNNVPNYCALGTNGGSVCNALDLASPIADVTNTATAPGGYSASIQLTAENLGPTGAAITSSAPANTNDATAMNVLRIAVTVSYRHYSLKLEGYRTRHAPNYIP